MIVFRANIKLFTCLICNLAVCFFRCIQVTHVTNTFHLNIQHELINMILYVLVKDNFVSVNMFTVLNVKT